MQVRNHSIRKLDPHPVHPVFQFECTQAPDLVALDFAKRFPVQKYPQFKKCILLANLSLSHKRLAHSENLDVLFLFKRQKNSLILQKSCIHHTCANEELTFANLENYFSESNHKTFVLNFSFSKQNPHEIISDFLQLKPVHIPKPWGQEIWYSGIESRGVSHLQINDQTIPLSWVLGAFPNLVFGKKHALKDPILLKILDPLPEPVKGDLYFELHLEKNEVYIVTSISSKSKVGRIKIGINPEKLKAYHYNTESYKTDFLNSILEYEKVRLKLDVLHEDNSQVVIDKNLIQKEAELRKLMDSFCGYQNLHVGDVVSVPTRVPHALQHGVQVIEFQTPTYERLIISFAQKVLTQNHWDTQQAFSEMKMQPFQSQKLKILSKTQSYLKELVCKFQDFKVLRWTINANTKLNWPAKPFYRIVFVISGSCKINTNTVAPQICIMIPQKQPFDIQCKDKSIILVCEPQISIS